MQILHEDDELIVFNKPSGLPSTAHRGQDSNTAVHEALCVFPKLPFPESLERGLLHRLDTGTSGTLAFAKTEAAYTHLRSIWKTEVGKIYRAVVSQASRNSATAIRVELPVMEGLAREMERRDMEGLAREIRLEIAHDAKSARRMRVLDPSAALPMKEQLRRIRGKPQPSHTIIVSARGLNGRMVLEPEVGTPDERAPGTRGERSERLWDVELRITTGVMHQIRVTLAHLGFPILGDELYRGAASSRLWLHAWKLEIGGRTIVAPLPEDWPGERR